jgi:hypothetical protein
VVVQCVPEDMNFSCRKLIPICLKTRELPGVCLTSCRIRLIVWLMDVVTFTFVDCCLFKFGDNTIFTIVYVMAVVTIQQKATTITTTEIYPRGSTVLGLFI